MRDRIAFATLALACSGCLLITDKEWEERIGMLPHSGETGEPAETGETGQPDSDSHSGDTETGDTETGDTETGGTDSDTDSDTDTSATECDQDEDGYVDESCEGGDDCDDTDTSIHPDATDLCDGIDSDCDGYDGIQSVLWFNDDDDHVTLSSSSEGSWLSLGEAWTVEFWIYVTETKPSGTDNILGKVSTGRESKLFQLKDGIPYISFVNSGGETVSLPGGGVVDSGDGWTHLAWVADAGRITLYRDGTLNVTSSASTEAADGDGEAFIGAFASSGTGMPEYDSMQGYISQVRVSSIARYTADFMPDGTPEADSDTITLWELNEGTGMEIKDSSDGDPVGGEVSGAEWNLETCPGP